MTSIVDSSVIIQTSVESAPAPPSWFGEIVLLVRYLRTHGVLTKISEQVRFARRRFGRYDVIDFLAVLFGYAISGERTLEAFYERIQPFAISFMALFDRDQLPARSTLSRFLAALTEVPVEALRTLFLDDLLSRPLVNEKQTEETGGLVDRAGSMWVGERPLLWRDWPRRHHRRACLHLLRQQRVEVQVGSGACAMPAGPPPPLSRAKRAHARLSWAERLTRNARVPTASQVTIHLFGVPEAFASSLGLATV